VTKVTNCRLGVNLFSGKRKWCKKSKKVKELIALYGEIHDSATERVSIFCLKRQTSKSPDGKKLVENDEYLV